MDFSDISSYSDKQVAHKIQELGDDVNFHQYISNNRQFKIKPNNIITSYW